MVSMAKFLDLTMSDGASVRAYLAPPPSGSGPGLVVIHGAGGLNADFCRLCDIYAEEGYAVLAIDLQRHVGAAQSLRDAANDVAAARPALAPFLEAAAKTGAIGFGSGALVAGAIGAMGAVDAVVAFGTAALAEEAALWRKLACPAALHIAGSERDVAAAAARIRSADRPRLRVHEYPGCGQSFFDPGSAEHEPHATTVAHTRSLAILRPALGPHYDFSTLLQEHLRHEFVTHDPDATMATMVAQPYVNHVPTLTGGVGHDMLKRFYKYHFIPNLPAKHRSVLISETVGPDAVILELVNTFTHDCEIDYLLPGIPPSGKELSVPVLVVAKFRGGQLYHEHIYWDQATLLVQLGLIDPKGLPVAGSEEARKMLDQSLPANRLMPSWRTSEGKPI
jgi:carboxymethylenebutenolidase